MSSGPTPTGKLNNILLNNHWIKEENKREVYKALKKNKNKNTTYGIFQKQYL